MADVVSKEKRSRMMSGIRGKNTKPEILVRKALFSRGFRYRLHDKNLPGKPDLVFPKYRAVIFVHGCFWHMHDCHLFKWPSSRPEFWRAKLEGNRQRDLLQLAALEEQGWRVLVIWECALKGKNRLPVTEVMDKAENFLKSDVLYDQIRGENPD
jgi:DNA mismatch endonuclease (patch repair protein)